MFSGRQHAARKRSLANQPAPDARQANNDTICMTFDAPGEIANANAASTGFVDGTHVQTPYGFEEIQFLSVGDVVLSRCEETGEIAQRSIAKCFSRNSESLLYVVTQSEIAGTDTIGAAAHHPFWVQGRGWVEARSLTAGDLLTASVGVRTVVLSVRDAGYRTALFNIEVEGLQTYFAGNHGVCVHNACKVA